jgi:hypothetical protein
MTEYQCVVCGAICYGRRKRRTCGKVCAKTAIQSGTIRGGAASAERAKSARNSPRFESDVCHVPLTQGAFTKIDARDAERVLGRSWYLFYNPINRKKYAVREERGVRVTLHRWILNADETKDVDHKNGDGLDNRRENLREATAAQNARNAKKRPSAASKFKGVNRDTSRTDRIWRARIRVDCKLIHLGRFSTEEEAARAYDEAARRLHGEFACVNFPIGGEQSAHR